MQVFLDKSGGKVLQFCEHSVIIACNDSNYQKVHFLIVLRVKKLHRTGDNRAVRLYFVGHILPN
jgi:hypothetical protein